MSNNPKGKYFRNTDSTSHWIYNSDYPLWKVIRASTAAPTFFDPEEITIIEQPGREPEQGQFVDGGVSPFNNPSLQSLLFATLKGLQPELVQWRRQPVVGVCGDRAQRSQQ